MEMAVRDKVPYKIVDVIGKIDRLKDSITLKSYLITLMEEGAKRVALNLAHITYLDSGALNVFIFGCNALKKSGGTLCIIEPNEYVMDVLEVVGLTKLITVYPSEEEFDKGISAKNN